MAAISHRRAGAADYTWPGYVDALTTLLMVLIFLLSVFSVAQFTLSDALTNKDTAIDALSKQIGSLADQLSIEKRSSQNLRRDIERFQEGRSVSARPDTAREMIWKLVKRNKVASLITVLLAGALLWGAGIYLQAQWQAAQAAVASFANSWPKAFCSR